MTQIIPIADDETGPSATERPFESHAPAPSSGNSRRAQAEESLPRSKTILIADDDASVRHMLGRVLESEQYNVVLARTGREAVAMFLAAPPDLVLLDLTMPEKDGWEAFHLMNATHPMIPVIIVTARPRQLDQAMRMRADALMEKPLNLALLLKAIGQLLAEPEPERKQRLANANLKTRHLNQSLENSLKGKP